MFKLLKRNGEGGVRFCERCGSVCDPSCLAQESRERAFEQVLRHGRWIA